MDRNKKATSHANAKAYVGRLAVAGDLGIEKLRVNQ
jgi:hypothetical protein